MIDFDLDKHTIHHIHFIGIGGISMSAIAEVLLSFGYTISGSDMNTSSITEKLMKKGIKITIGHHKDNISSCCDLVVYTAAIKEDNPELIKAKELHIPIIDRAGMLGLLMKKFEKSIAISGTHGKTTTTSMISLILEYSHFHPTILVGGELDEIGGNVKVGDRKYFVTEACEYVESFLKLSPKLGIILNIDTDHLDYFRDLDHIVQSFTKFAQRIPSDGMLIAFKHDKNLEKVLQKIDCHIITYGIDETCDYWADNVVFNNRGCTSFDVFHHHRLLGHFQLHIPGMHNVYNALSAIACCDTLGVSTEKIVKCLKNFKGTHRRFDIIGTINNITVIDDYAHHPTEIKATLAATTKYSHHNICCIFQPHTYTRTKTLLHDFASCFKDADQVIITDIYGAREKDTGEIHAIDLVKTIAMYHKNVIYIDNFEKIARYIQDTAKPNDLILTMGAGNIYKLAPMIVEALHKKYVK
jgi:UDP-N-acetylmuramate--alanine ligase